MSDNKKYYYLKLKDNFFDTEEIKILESMPNGIFYSNLLIKLYLKSLKFNGALRFNDFIPYDESMIATITNLNIDVVRSGLRILSSMKLIERLDDGTIYMMNIQSLIGKSSSEADRKKLYREQIEEEKLLLGQKKHRREHSRELNLKQEAEPEEIAKVKNIDGITEVNNIDEIEKGQMSLKCPDICPPNVGTFLDKRPPEIENRDRDKELENRDRDKRKEIESNEKFQIEQQLKKEQEIESQSIDLVKYFESITGLIGGLNLAAIKLAVSKHGAENVKKAINKALEKNKPTMIYINGILRNWAKEGYPKEGEGIKNGSSINGRDTKTTEYMGFKPKEPRKLTEEELKEISSELI